MRSSLLLLALAGCATDTVDLIGGPGADAGTTSNPDASGPVEPVLPGCLVPDDIAERNLTQMNEIGFLISPSRIQGRLSNAQRMDDGNYRIELAIEEVFYGLSFLENVTTRFVVDQATYESLELPGSYILGFGQNPAPVRNPEGILEWWAPQVFAPARDIAKYSALLGYDASTTPIVAIARVASVQDSRPTLEITALLRGTDALPATPFLADLAWSDIYGAQYPAPSGTEYIVSLFDLSEINGRLVGSAVDFRVATPASIDEVRAELLSLQPRIDSAALMDNAHEHKLSWLFHRSANVLTTEVIGFAEDCCTGAGGTYVKQQVNSTLFGPTGRAEVYTGGHGFRGPEVCGDRFLLGLRDIATSAPPEQAPFGCAEPGIIGPGIFATSDIRAALPHDSANETRVRRWIGASEPVYLLRKPDSPRTIYDARDSLWSERAAVQEALAIAALTRVRVIGVEGDDVTLETSFSAYNYDHLEKHRVTLTDHCMDPRLREVGAEYFVSLYRDEIPLALPGKNPVESGGAMIIPGVMLPVREWILRSSDAFGTLLIR